MLATLASPPDDIARFQVTPPTQDRARRTTDRIVAAVEALLHDRSFESITIQEIVTRAQTTTGSFYARFASKDALLPFIYDRYDTELSARIEERLQRISWDRLPLADAIRARVRIMIEMYEERRWLMRAVTLFARQHPEGLPAEVVARRAQSFDRWNRMLARFGDEITHPEPNAAFAFVMFLLASTAREALLFGEAPQAQITPTLRSSLEDELTRAALGYLTVPLPPDTPGATC